MCTISNKWRFLVSITFSFDYLLGLFFAFHQIFPSSFLNYEFLGLSRLFCKLNIFLLIEPLQHFFGDSAKQHCVFPRVEQKWNCPGSSEVTNPFSFSYFFLHSARWRGWSSSKRCKLTSAIFKDMYWCIIHTIIFGVTRFSTVSFAFQIINSFRIFAITVSIKPYSENIVYFFFFFWTRCTLFIFKTASCYFQLLAVVNITFL